MYKKINYLQVIQAWNRDLAAIIYTQRKLQSGKKKQKENVSKMFDSVVQLTTNVVREQVGILGDTFPFMVLQMMNLLIKFNYYMSRV